LRDGYTVKTTRSTAKGTYEVSTSGSTGKNFHVMEDSETAGCYRASFMLALEWAGWTIGEPHLQTGMTLNRSFDRWLKDAFLRCHYVSAYDLTDSRLDQNLEILSKNKLNFLWGYPGSLYYLAKRALQRGFTHKLRAAVTWGDNLYPHYRSAIEKAFNTRVYDTYGCAEGIQISAQCGTENNYHIHTLDAIVEFIDQHGNTVDDTAAGNILVTRLHPGPMPLIRYQIGDLGVAGTKKTCPCGRGFELMESVQGRDTDVVITPSGNRLIVHFFTGILENFPEIDSFQVMQKELESIQIRIVPVNGWDKDCEQRVIQALKDKGAVGIKIEIERVSEIPVASSGKRRFVISSISKPNLSGKQQ
jgi:phenylacetate-CoA ligase